MKSHQSTYLNKVESLIDLASILENEGDYQQILQLISQKAAIYFQSDFAIIMMINPQTHQTVKTIFSEGEKTNRDKNRIVHTNVCGWVIKNNETLMSVNIKKDNRFRKNLLKNSSYISVLCAPLRSEGVVIGTMFLARESKIPYEDDDLDFLNKFSSIISPFLRNVQKINQYFDRQVSDNTLIQKYETLGLIGKSPKFIELLKTIEIATQSDIRVLLEGRSGTGKELIAKAIHKLSDRSAKKFIAFDCGTVPENLMESELFGHVKGAFTGAISDRKGLIHEADGGTLFLDEISNLSLDLQAKLLRILQEGEIRPLGCNETISVDTRIICANSNSLIKLVQQNKFREDLFYRIYVYPIFVPSLSNRREDIPILANYFIEKFSKEQTKKVKHLHEDLIDFLKIHPWSGNIRELEHFIERLIALAPGDLEIINHHLLPAEYKKEWKKVKSSIDTQMSVSSLTDNVAEFETNLIRKALIDSNWNQSKAARALNISEKTIRYKMEKLGIINPH
jgi:transcriptional regulator with GAF, ATPase, and Fis domain